MPDAPRRPAPEHAVESEEPIVLTLADDEASGHLQALAGVGLWSSLALDPGARPAPRPPREPLAAGGDWQVVYDGPALDGGRPRTVRALRDAAGRRRVDFEDGESYLIAADGRAIRRWRAPSAAESMPPLDRALGAPLALALALRGIHLLHASALARESAALAVSAPPGVGKSTLAAAAAGRPELGWRRVADDILPARLGAVSRALPHFPQLKLAPGEGYPPSAPAELRLAAVVELERRPTADGEVRLERLPPAAAALALARAGVAVRLFDGELLAAHLAACARAAEATTVARLSLPTARGRLGEALAALADLVA